MVQCIWMKRRDINSEVGRNSNIWYLPTWMWVERATSWVKPDFCRDLVNWLLSKSLQTSLSSSFTWKNTFWILHNYSAWISRQLKYGLLNYSRTCPLEWIITNSHFFPVLLDELLLLLISFSPLLNRTNLCFNVKFWNTPSQLKDSPSVSLALPRSHSCRQQRADSFPENIE